MYSHMELTTPLLHQALYRLFAWLFLYPDEERLRASQTGAVELLENDGLWLNEPYAASLRPVLERLAALDEPGQEELTREHSRLFAIRPMAPPYESIYTAPSTEGRGWVSAQLERLYARHGLAISGLNELPDHLAVELEFLSYLCEAEAAALGNENPQDAADFQQARWDFLDRHPRKWLGSFSRRVQAAAPDGFYAAVVEALMDFIAN